MAEKTAYVVLRRHDVPTSPPSELMDARWEAVATEEAHSGDHAKRLYAESQSLQPDAWDWSWLVAVPARSWTPTLVTIERKIVVNMTGGE